MSSVAVPSVRRAARFYEAPLGKKVVMAVTGMILFSYVVAHLAGNLQVYSADHQQINRYAAALHNPTVAVLLWGVRAMLLLAVALHIIAALQLWNLKRIARPIAYVNKDDVPAAYAARTMIWSGSIILAFVIFHILHLTAGTVLPLEELGPNRPNVRANLIGGFQHPAVAGFYIVAMLLVCLHLHHGLWSMFQSVGVSHPRYTVWLKRFSAASALAIAFANISIPVAVLAGWLTQ